MEKLFVSKELAVKLKEKGFDEECLAYWSEGELFAKTSNGIKSGIKNQDLYPTKYLAPTHQQVIDFFREKHNLVLDVFQEFNGTDAYTGFWEVDISELRNYKQPHILVIEETFETYYEALNKAIESALTLI